MGFNGYRGELKRSFSILDLLMIYLLNNLNVFPFR